MGETEKRKQWVKENTVFIGLRLQRSTDGDILSAIDGKAKQTEIKRLLRIGLKHDGPEQ